MSIQIALAFALATGTGTTSSLELCGGVASKIEPNMRIIESDLDRAAAVVAAEKLRIMIDRGDVDGEFQFGALNQVKVIQGHILLRQAQADREEFGAHSSESRDSTTALCSWLGNEGFWYD